MLLDHEDGQMTCAHEDHHGQIPAAFADAAECGLRMWQAPARAHGT